MTRNPAMVHASSSPALSAEEEARYRHHFLRADARRALIVIGTVCAIWGLGLFNDHRLFGWGATFFLLLGIHAVSWLLNAAVCAVLVRSEDPKAHDRAITVFLVTTVLAAAYVVSTRPPEYLGYAVTTTFGISIFYLAVPGPLAVRALSALGLTAATFWSSLRGPAPPIGIAAVLGTHVLSHALGIVVARWLEALRRTGFVAEEGERRAREELAKKAEDLEAAKQRAESLAKSRSDFLATMSHEFRTPMNAVLGLSEMLAASSLAPDHQEMATTIQQSARALLVLLNDILDLSKIEAGRMLIEQAPFDVREVVRGTVDLVAYQAAEKSLKLSLEIEPDVPAGLSGDAARIRQVLLNLLSNAVKFTERGSIEARVRLGDTRGEANEVIFAVRDTGPGIPADVRERLFAPFEQGTAPISQRRGGSGLGLSICKRLAAMMNGEIRVESEVGRGSVFELRIVARAAEVQRAKAEEAPAPTLAERRLRILLVEDNGLNERVALAMFRRLGCRADVARSGREAIEAVERKGYDVLLMDLRMPEMDGIEAASRIRSSAAVIGRPRIVAMTASAFEEDRLACMEAGMEDFISKPVHIEELHATLMRTLHAQPARREDEEEGPARLSLAALDELRKLEGPENPGFFVELCRQFEDHSRERTEAIARAAAEGSAQLVEREAHSLKSMSGSMGAARLAELCETLEASARRGELAGWEGTVAALRKELSRVRVALANVG